MSNDYENRTASDLFDSSWKLQQELEKSSDESSENYSIKRKQAIEMLRKCTEMLDELHLFSENESIDEISTSEIRYFLADALLAWLLAKINSTSPNIRLVALEEAKHYIIKFLRLTKSYNFHTFNIDKFESDNTESARLDQVSVNLSNKQAAFDMNMLNQAYERSEKIKRFKEQKELETQINLVQSGNLTNIDEEHRRKFYNTCVKYWVNKSIDDLKVVTDEINILKSIDKEKQFKAENHNQKNNRNHGAAASNLPEVKKPFIITRDAIQAKVFGAGYPSVPVYSIEQFYDHLADEGHMPKPGASDENYAPVQIGGGVTETQKQNDKAEKDLLEDKHDEEELRRQREWDEFKDENKRGAGNRFNRS